MYYMYFMYWHVMAELPVSTRLVFIISYYIYVYYYRFIVLLFTFMFICISYLLPKGSVAVCKFRSLPGDQALGL